MCNVVWKEVPWNVTTIPLSLLMLTDTAQERLWGRVACSTEGGVKVVLIGVVIVREFKEPPHDAMLG